MLTVRTAAHISTSRHLWSFRLCPTSTGVTVAQTCAFSPLRQWFRLLNAESRRLWLDRQWGMHMRRVHSRQGGGNNEGL